MEVEGKEADEPEVFDEGNKTMKNDLNDKFINDCWFLVWAYNRNIHAVVAFSLTLESIFDIVVHPRT